MTSPPPHLRLVEPGPQTAEGSTSPEPATLPTLNEIFRRYSPYVAAIGLRLLGRVEEIEDVVQDVFIAAHRGLAGLREPALRLAGTVTVRLAQRRLLARRVRIMLRLMPTYDRSSRSRAFAADRLWSRSVRDLDDLPVA